MSLTWGANSKFVLTSHLPPIFHSVCMTSQIKQFGFITMEKTKKTPCRPLVSANANPKVLAAQVATTRSSSCRVRPPRVRCPPAYLTQDQRGELSRSLISGIAAAKATKPADDSSHDNDGNDNN